MLAPPGPDTIVGVPLGHFIGMLQSMLVSLHRNKSVHLVDVWDPAEVLRLMLAEDLGMGGGSTFFLTSLLDHPDCTPAHIARMPVVGLGGSSVPAAVTDRADQARHRGVSVVREHGASVGDRQFHRRAAGEAQHH